MREHQQKYITSDEQESEAMPLSSPCVQNTIVEMPVFTDLGVNSLNALTGSPRKNYWDLSWSESNE
jgi:hypothetical protein